ncbi:hypothetical protein GCM10027275_29170 [Rhabdobacter roseus]|uniref:DUF1573 domain-containing protein n=1 Tax=Rhabdobacter roseus TaxID=1655419 RepID=A0A840TXE1_9BACT|nr:DUF1573 domain-containing protein [Rhabdobacter roseus]MBB5284868.1 hypothetical protein [Rhabdobacter roseus]
MKKFFSILAVLLVVATASYAQKGVMKFKEETHNFGKIEQGKPVTQEFVFTNTGTDPIVISNVSASCGCTTPSYTKDPILPGKTGTIKATYNAAAMGSFNKSITVFSNAETPSMSLFLKGEVVTKEQATKPSTK